MAVCVLGDAIHPTGPPSSSCPDLFRASLAASSVGGWSAAWTAGYPEPVRAGPAMTCREHGGTSSDCPKPPDAVGPGRDASGTLSGRDSPGLSGINWDSAGFHGSTGADETARSGGRGLPSTASRMAATASGERPFLGGAWPGACPAPGAALAADFAAACSRSRRSLSVPSMRLRTSARRASADSHQCSRSFSLNVATYSQQSSHPLSAWQPPRSEATRLR